MYLVVAGVGFGVWMIASMLGGETAKGGAGLDAQGVVMGLGMATTLFALALFIWTSGGGLLAAPFALWGLSSLWVAFRG